LEEYAMSVIATALPLSSQNISESPKTKTARAGVETLSHVSGIMSLADAGTHLGKVATVIEKGITKGATRAATVASKWGWRKLAGLFLKIAAAAPLAAKSLVGVAVVAVAVTIYYIVRPA
jgi:hypothetical protein